MRCMALPPMMVVLSWSYSTSCSLNEQFPLGAASAEMVEQHVSGATDAVVLRKDTGEGTRAVLCFSPQACVDCATSILH